MSDHAANATRRIDLMPRIRLRGNWRDDKVKMGHFLISGMGGALDDVAERFVMSVKAASGPWARVGWAAESEQIEGRSRSVRVLSSIRGQHHAAVDANLYAKGRDLYVRFETLAFTPIVYMRWLTYALLFIVSFSVVYVAYFALTDARTALATAYAERYKSGDNAVLVQQELLHGSSAHDPYKLVDYFRKDPRLFLREMGTQPVIIAVIVGFLLRLLPKDILRHPCLILGWPTPDVFKNHILAHTGEVEAAFGRMMAEHYAVYEGSGITRIHAG
jgi:hypothetical protein